MGQAVASTELRSNPSWNVTLRFPEPGQNCFPRTLQRSCAVDQGHLVLNHAGQPLNKVTDPPDSFLPQLAFLPGPGRGVTDLHSKLHRNLQRVPGRKVREGPGCAVLLWVVKVTDPPPWQVTSTLATRSCGCHRGPSTPQKSDGPPGSWQRDKHTTDLRKDDLGVLTSALAVTSP